MNEKSRAANDGSLHERGDRLREAVHHVGPFALDEVEGAARLLGTRADRASRRRRACRRRCSRGRRSRRAASSRTAVVSAVRPRTPLRLSRWRSSGPCWWITPLGALVDPEVCTITMRSLGRDVGFEVVDRSVGDGRRGARGGRRRCGRGGRRAVVALARDEHACAGAARRRGTTAPAAARSIAGNARPSAAT